MSERVIRVTGKGKISLSPDKTVIRLDLNGSRKEYREALIASGEATDQVKASLAPLGFKKDAVKTVSFDIDPEYESYQEKNVWKQRLVGYRYSHSLKLEFPRDRELLAFTLGALSLCPASPSVSISYGLMDPEAAKNKLLGLACQDALAKAKTLAEASGVRLGELLSVDYSWGQAELEVRPMRKTMALGARMMTDEAAVDVDMEPDDITTTDTVTMVWAMK